MKIYTTFLLATLLFPLLSYGKAEDTFISLHKVKVKRGDGIITLLKRYDLIDHRCNIDAFYQANNLKKGDALYADRQYTLPIRVYQYNKTSIRSTIGINEWDRAIKIQDYNKKLKSDGVKPKYYMDDGILYVPFHLIDCPTSSATATISSSPNAKVAKQGSQESEAISEKVKTAKSEEVAEKEEKRIMLTNELYGTHKTFEKANDRLKDQVFYIISGHGGPDPGAVCAHGKTRLCEDEYAYDVSLRLARNLEANGAKVHLIIQDKNDGIRDQPILELDYDEVCIDGNSIPRKQLPRLKQRVDAVNKLYKTEKSKYKSHKVISIHVDSRHENKRQDVFFYYCPGSKKGKSIAQNIHEVFEQKYKIHRRDGEYHGTVTDRNLYVLRNTNPVAVFVELANIRNHIDQDRILIPSNRQALADWLFLGLTQ